MVLLKSTQIMLNNLYEFLRSAPSTIFFLLYYIQTCKYNILFTICKGCLQKGNIKKSQVYNLMSVFGHHFKLKHTIFFSKIRLRTLSKIEDTGRIGLLL